MKVLIVSQYFYPEIFKINDLAISLNKLNIEVTVITGKPNYPIGRYYDGYGLFSKIIDNYHGVKVIRLPIIPRGNGSSLMLALNYISFVFVSSLFLIFLRKKFSFSFVFGVSPILATIPAIIHKIIYGTSLKLWILDLWPDSVFVTGRLKSPIFLSILDYIVRKIYNHSDTIFYSSKFMENSIRNKIKRKNLNRIKLEYLPNWAEIVFDISQPDYNKYSKKIPSGFIILCAGNIGYGQDIPSLIEVAKKLKGYPNIKLVFLGDGSEKRYLSEKIIEYNLEKTVYILGSYPVEEMPHFFAVCDLLLISLRNEKPYLNTVPGRLQSYMASAKPIIGMISGEAAEIINECNCGFVSNAGDFEGLVLNAIKLSKYSVDELHILGKNGYEYFQNNFTLKKSINKIIN